MIKVFKGKIFGIELFTDKENWDNRIIFTILIEDDGWNVYNVTIDYSPSYWIDDLINISNETKEWMEKFCIKTDTCWKFNEEYKNKWNEER